VIDDFHYPDIAQQVGMIPADSTATAERPARIVDASISEDQSLCWSPNGRWIAYHSHKENGDDLWLVPADGSAPARRITSFGRGFETGWPRWSPDGKWLVFDADSRDAGPRRSLIYVMGLDQETGTVTRPAVPSNLDGYPGEGLHAEWLPGSDRLAVHGWEPPDRHSLLLVPRDGGPAQVVHRWQSEHRIGGLGVSPDGAWAAFPAPANGYFQIFRVPLSGGPPQQLTVDPGNKTQPSYSPDGRRIALTVWEYQVQFWLLDPR
jgi:Tol biopolymer transport system component